MKNEIKRSGFSHFTVAPGTNICMDPDTLDEYMSDPLAWDPRIDKVERTKNSIVEYRKIITNGKVQIMSWPEFTQCYNGQHEIWRKSEIALLP